MTEPSELLSAHFDASFATAHAPAYGARIARITEALGVLVEAETFAAYVAKHAEGRHAIEADSDEPLFELYLAAALRARSPAAAAVFERRYVATLDRALAKLKLSSSELDEAKQRTREKLLVPSSREGAATAELRIEAYAGQGKLAGLVQVVATREALTVFRRERRDAPLAEEALAERALERDPALEALKGRAREAFRVAFEEAVNALDPRGRNLLRLHLLGGVTLEQLAKVHDVHRATVVRWLAAARDEVFTRTRRSMQDALGMAGPEVESVLGALQSRLDVSVERILGKGDG